MTPKSWGASSPPASGDRSRPRPRFLVEEERREGLVGRVDVVDEPELEGACRERQPRFLRDDRLLERSELLDQLVVLALVGVVAGVGVETHQELLGDEM